MSAELYRKVWTPEGSPLLVTRASGRPRGSSGASRARAGDRCRVALGMRYGNPSIAKALARARGSGLPAHRRPAALPAVLRRHRRLDLRRGLRRAHADGAGCRSCARSRRYHDEPGYIAALAASVRERWQARGRSREAPDVVPRHAAALLRRRRPVLLLLPEDGAARRRGARRCRAERWQLTFQSLFGREEWLKPYTDQHCRGARQAGRARARRHLPRLLRRLPRDDRGDRPVSTARSSCTTAASASATFPASTTATTISTFSPISCARHLAGWAWAERRAARRRTPRTRRADTARRAGAMKARPGRLSGGAAHPLGQSLRRDDSSMTIHPKCAARNAPWTPSDSSV